jgi:leucyl-tRNA synthetase
MVSKTSEAAHQFSYRKYVTEAFFEHLNRVEEYKSMILDGDERRRTLWDVIEIWLRVLAPVMPHIAEELWERMLKSGYISLAEFPLYDDLYAETLPQKGFLDGVITDISNIQAAIKRETESVFIYLPAQWKYTLYGVARGLDDLSIRNIIARAKDDPLLRMYVKEIAHIAPDLVKSLAHEAPSAGALDFKAESETLLAAKDYMTRKFGKHVYVCEENNNVYDPANRARRALPTKPAIYAE